MYFHSFTPIYEEVDYDDIKMDMLFADIDRFSKTHTPDEVFNFLKNGQFLNSQGKNIGIDLAVSAFNRHPNRKSYLIATPDGKIINKRHEAIKTGAIYAGVIGGGAFLANKLRKKLSFFNKVEDKLVQKQEVIKQVSPNLKEVSFIDTLIRKVKLFIAYLKQRLKNLIS
jgi:hypothetical protein